MKKVRDQRTRNEIKLWLLFYIVAILFSGITAFYIHSGSQAIAAYIEAHPFVSGLAPDTTAWFIQVTAGIDFMDQHHSFIFYGTDWLAYAHIMIAILFIGPIIDPVKNIWVIHFGMICCVMIIPTALIFGSIRSIPFTWQLIDCSFGVFGLIPLLIIQKKIKYLGFIIRRGA